MVGLVNVNREGAGVGLRCATIDGIGHGSIAGRRGDGHGDRFTHAAASGRDIDGNIIPVIGHGGHLADVAIAVNGNRLDSDGSRTVGYHGLVVRVIDIAVHGGDTTIQGVIDGATIGCGHGHLNVVKLLIGRAAGRRDHGRRNLGSLTLVDVNRLLATGIA